MACRPVCRDRGRLVALGVALVEVVEPEAAELLVLERAHVGVAEDDGVARTRQRRVVGDLAVVLAVRALDEEAAEQPRVLQVIVVAALHAAAVARVRDLAVAAPADLGRVVQEREPEGVVRGRSPRGAAVELVLPFLDRADHVDSVEGDDGFVLPQAAVAAEEPRLVDRERAAAGERRVEPGELLVGGVAVLGDEAVVLEEVVDRAADPVGARPGDDVRQQPRGADVLRRDAAGQHLLLLDDLGVEVGAERAAHAVGDVDAVDVVEVVARHAREAADVGVVQARLRRRIPGPREHARHELQVALVAAARRDGLGEVERDVLGHDGARHVDDRRRGGHHHGLGHVADGHAHGERRRLARPDEDVRPPGGLESLQLDGHHVPGGRAQGAQLRQARAVGEPDPRGRGVLGRGRDGGAGDRQPGLVGDRHADVPGGGHLRRGGRGGRRHQRGRHCDHCGRHDRRSGAIPRGRPAHPRPRLGQRPNRHRFIHPRPPVVAARHRPPVVVCPSSPARRRPPVVVRPLSSARCRPPVVVRPLRITAHPCAPPARRRSAPYRTGA